jgi:hypothetical protein
MGARTDHSSGLAVHQQGHRGVTGEVGERRRWVPVDVDDRVAGPGDGGFIGVEGHVVSSLRFRVGFSLVGDGRRVRRVAAPIQRRGVCRGPVIVVVTTAGS